MSSSNKTVRSKPVVKKLQVDDRQKFQPLPKPTGQYPFRFKPEELQDVAVGGKMVFHMVGDTGSVRQPEFQRIVAREMIKQYQQATSSQDRPLFLYHLGDVVYNFGEAEQYYRQFFEPYKDYPGPVFAIPGNHDSDVNPDSLHPYRSLDAFTQVFCDTRSREITLAGDTGRKSITQPNLYWTLQTPLADFIGLYGNVPKYGVITDEQKDWFISELKAAATERAEKAIIVCLHHAPYSADINHGASIAMIQFLEAAYKEAGVKPDIVFSGHVHSYQRFSKQYDDGRKIPYIVAGAGGFADLHAVAAVDDPAFLDDSNLFDNVVLDNYCDDKHGFLKIAIEKTSTGLLISGEYYAMPHTMDTGASSAASFFDQFTVNLPRLRE
ncbi:MAG: phoA [Segetibacter sp.]|nr:phoA [Segetibacter sp.]